MATLLTAGGREGEVNPANGSRFTLAELQAAVGGYIELLRLNDGRLMVLNDEGKLKGLPFNQMASALAWGRLGPGDYVVGDVLVCVGREID